MPITFAGAVLLDSLLLHLPPGSLHPAGMRNAHVHDLTADNTFRQVHELWIRARMTGIEHRFHSYDEELESARNVIEAGELADHFFDPASELADLCNKKNFWLDPAEDAS